MKILFDIMDILKKKFTKDFLWLFSGSLSMAISAIVINIIIGNTFGAKSLGIFNQALAVYSILSILAAFGLQNSSLKFISEENNLDDQNNIVMK